MPLLRPLGLGPRMTAEQQADSNIELGVVSRERELGPVLDTITVPVRYVVASGRPSEAAVTSRNGSAPASMR
jgi:hypothetical protein